MAKHVKGKAVSKGLRRSSINAGKKPVRPAITAERVGTAMREAFLNVKIVNNISTIKAKAGKAATVDAIITCAKQNAGNNKVGRGWTANLSPRTVRALTEQGVFA